MPPPKKKNYSAAAMKKKRLIDNRLLQISLLVEDYIFEDKPISRHEAEMYAKEVASYESKCLGDERSLQVIEKLQRHMKGIIAEQGQPIDEDIFTQPLPGTTPVHEILDDDMTQYVQDTEVEDLTQGFNSLNCDEKPVKNRRNKRKATVKRNIKDNSELDDDLTQYTQNTDADDLTQEFNSLNSITKAGKKRKAVKRNMRKTYSIDDDLTQYTQDVDVEFDIQGKASLGSINKSNIRPRNKRNTIVKRNIRQIKVKKHVSDNYNSAVDVIDISDDDKVTGFNNNRNVGVSPQEKISDLCIDDNEVPNTPAVLSVCSPSILTSLDTVPVIPTYNKEGLFEKPNADENGITKFIVKSVNKSTKTLINKNIELQMETTDRKIPGNGITKDNAITGRNNSTPYIFNTQKTSDNLTALSKNKIDKALNTNSKVNKVKKGFDLSWVQNIQYVREIGQDEYVNLLVPENFWDNCTLPEKWNDDDFSYT